MFASSDKANNSVTIKFHSSTWNYFDILKMEQWRVAIGFTHYNTGLYNIPHEKKKYNDNRKIIESRINENQKSKVMDYLKSITRDLSK